MVGLLRRDPVLSVTVTALSRIFISVLSGRLTSAIPLIRMRLLLNTSAQKDCLADITCLFATGEVPVAVRATYQIVRVRALREGTAGRSMKISASDLCAGLVMDLHTPVHVAIILTVLLGIVGINIIPGNSIIINEFGTTGVNGRAQRLSSHWIEAIIVCLTARAKCGSINLRRFLDCHVWNSSPLEPPSPSPSPECPVDFAAYLYSR